MSNDEPTALPPGTNGPVETLDNKSVSAAPKRDLPPEAQRALAEAEARRNARIAAGAQPAKEVGGREGPDPARYGDWETGGIASDF